jgi:hypothetical protein
VRATSNAVGVLCLSLIFAISSPLYSKGADVQLHGTVTRVDLTQGGASSIRVRVMGFEIPVTVTGDTGIEFLGDEFDLSDIGVGDFVRIIGFFSNSGITADEIIIVDMGDGEFRFRGVVQSVRSSGGTTIAVVFGEEVVINSETTVIRRGELGPFNPANIVANMIMDAHGFYESGRFIATKVKVGIRDDDPVRVRFKGKIINVTSTGFTVDTNGGSNAVVLADTTTLVTGRLAAGQSVEVSGTLNRNLQVVANRVIAKGSPEEEETPQPVKHFEKGIAIVPVGATSSVEGDARLELKSVDGQIEERIEVRFKKALPNTAYTIRFDLTGSGVVSLPVQTDGDGKAELKQNGSALPNGKTVRDITRVQIVTATVVAAGTF